MAKLPQTSDTYDRIFAGGGYGGVYELPYQHSMYYPLFREVAREVRHYGAQSLLEVGCGTGGFAQLVMETMSVHYQGFDFSRVAVEKTVARTKRPDLISVADATSALTYRDRDYDCVVCTEVLEHIVDDLEAISHWRPGALCVCSVPNFDDKAHERFFLTESDVQARYGEQIEIERIRRVKRPILGDISLANRMKELRWARYRPRRFFDILGFGNFDRVGGWFLFSGRKR